jgi:membrane-bound lytic murein transglycosylase B
LKKRNNPVKFHPNMKRGLKRSLPLLLILAFFNSMAYSQELKEIPPVYQLLLSRLSQEGFEFNFLSKIFIDPRAEIIPERMILYLVSREITELYQQFLTPESISLARTFLRQNRKLLRRMEDQFHVEMEVVSAILLVESRFGENIGKYRVIPTLASMALMDSPENLQKNYQALKDTNAGLSYEWVEGFAKRKAGWAYDELKCFLNIIQQEKIDPLEVYGSYAGALGMAQFIPSSYLAYAQSKKGLENWLLNKEEAISSIGNYLKSHGWKKKMSIEKKKQVLWYYNHSESYVETILQLAQKIKNR